MSEFDNWKEEQERIHNDYDAENAWNAGQQSQQAKIELLEKELTETQAFLNKQNHIKQTKIDELKKLRSLDEMTISQLAQANQVWQIKCNELQGRIDEALNTLCKLQYSSGERIYSEVGNILKGNKDE